MSISIDQIDIGSVVEVNNGILTILGFNKSRTQFVGEGSSGIHDGNSLGYWYDKRGNKIPYYDSSTKRIFRSVDNITAIISGGIPKESDKPLFKEGNRVRIIRTPDQVSWGSVRKVGLSREKVGNIVILKDAYSPNNKGKYFRIEGNGSSVYPAEMFELVTTETQSSNTPQDYIKVGDYIFITKAGGWGYAPENNNSIAKVSKIHPIGISRLKEYGRCFDGTVIEPRYNSAVNFRKIPEIAYGETIVRKATLDDFNRLGVKLPMEFMGKKESKEDTTTDWSEGVDYVVIPSKPVSQQPKNITLSYEDDEDDYTPKVIPTKNITIN